MRAYEPLVSVIVPVFNTAAFLPRCLESIIRQTYENIEIILVNDGSTDDSLSICREFNRKDTRIRILDGPHKGLSHARNKGLDQASGDRILFCDSDDYLDIRTVEIMLGTIEREECAVCVCGVKREGIEDSVFPDPPVETVLSFPDMLEALLAGSFVKSWVCNKMYTRECISPFRFDEELRKYEDIDFQLRLFSQAPGMQKCAFIPDVLYHYVIRRSGLSVSMKFTLDSCERLMRHTLPPLRKTENWLVRKCKLCIYENMAIREASHITLAMAMLYLRNAIFLFVFRRTTKKITID